MIHTRRALRRSWPYLLILAIFLLYAAAPLCAATCAPGAFANEVDR